MQEIPTSAQKLGGIISIKEAKKLLGGEYTSMPDEMVELTISDMAILASVLIDWQNGSTKLEGML